jgi:hypothetical protein
MKTHGHTSREGRSPTYTSWGAMVRRCHNPKAKDFPRYGGRGVAVCARWRDFANFLADMGEKAPGMTLERSNNEKGYEPGNCIWATRATQMRNTSYNEFVVLRGERMCVADAAKALGIGRAKLYWPAHKYGLPHQAVLNEVMAAMASGRKPVYSAVSGR